jgi:hypothetical protein
LVSHLLTGEAGLCCPIAAKVTSARALRLFIFQGAKVELIEQVLNRRYQKPATYLFTINYIFKRPIKNE